jgi:hypothetical protein
MLGLLVAAAKILAVKAGTSIDPACLPLSASLPCHPACPCQPACLVIRPVLRVPTTGALVEVDSLQTNMP